MTTDTKDEGARHERLTANLARIEDLTRRMSSAMALRKKGDPALTGPSADFYQQAATALVAEMMKNPSRLIEQQVGYWGKTLQQYLDAQQELLKGELKAPEPKPAEGPQDRRFGNPLWNEHPFFSYLKQQYLLNADAMTSIAGNLDHLETGDRKRVEFFSRQIVDMFSPTNFLGTNPDALQRAVETDGESLVRGLENLVRDIEANKGDLLVTLADPGAFRVGANIATTPGSVVFRNHMLELIQYSPTTETVHQTPLLVFPPWINKFYILDLKPANSLIKWIVDQGYTLFVVSWVNPDPSYRDIGMDDYIRDGYLAAIEEVKRITGEKQVNTVGYCIAGTTLSLTLAHLQKQGDKSIKSATFFTTLTDFSDTGEVGVFLSDDFVDGIERQVSADGILNKLYMGRTFSFLRSNDLIWQPAIKSYMMGEAPPAFDLLYWNGDGTNLPAKMSVEYLRGLCQRDEFAAGEGFPVLGTRVKLSDVKVPLCAIACETDHIAAWKACFSGVRQMGSKDKTFIVSESGHIAGIVNPPTKDKYGHYTNDPSEMKPDTTADEWFSSATYNKGSWWPRWGEWLGARSGRMVPARVPGDSTNPVLAPAPGSYVVAVPAA